MAFCPKCGKQIADGATCDCQDKVITTAQAKEAATGALGSAVDIISDPVGGVKRFIDSVTWIRTIVLVAISYLISVIVDLKYYLKANHEHKKWLEDAADRLDMDIDEYCDEFDIDEVQYGFGKIFKAEIQDLLLAVASVAITAVVIFFVFKLFNQVVITWEKAFAMATITMLVTIPCSVVNFILGLIPSFKLLSWIMSSITACSVAIQAMLTYTAYKGEVVDTKKCIYTFVIAETVGTFAYLFVSFLINALF